VAGTVGGSATLAQTLLLLLEDPDRRSSMGAAAQQKVAAQFTQEHMIQEIVAFYRRLLVDR
jgi:glycosyltransferase involved in cell wall biosynthesis